MVPYIRKLRFTKRATRKLGSSSMEGAHSHITTKWFEETLIIWGILFSYQAVALLMITVNIREHRIQRIKAKVNKIRQTLILSYTSLLSPLR
jgi:hypothetical protein